MAALEAEFLHAKFWGENGWARIHFGWDKRFLAAAKRIEQEKLITSSGKLCVFRLEWAKKGEKEGIYRGKLEVRTPVRRKTLIGFYMICPGAKLLGGFSLKCVNNWPTKFVSSSWRAL